MEAKKQATTALLTEHFTYTPLTLLDDIINTVNELVFRAVNAIENGLNSKSARDIGFTLDEATASSLTSDDAREDALAQLKQNEIDNGIVKLESLLNATVDKDFDKFEIYTLRNILAVGHDEEDLARWVRLDHYKDVDVKVVDGEKAISPEEVLKSRERLHETAKLNGMLRAEEARNAVVLKQLTQLIGANNEAAPFGFLSNGQGSHLAKDTQQVLGQIPALQELLGQLKDAMGTISNAKAKYEDEDSAAARRRRYLNTQGRRALERKGIDPDAPAGSSIAVGRRVGLDELEGIEAVAQAFAGADDRRT